MQGDSLAILLFAWSLAVAFFFEGRREAGWRHWLFWGFALAFLLAGPLWPHLTPLWPQGEAAGRQIATDPQSWFVVFMAVMVLIAVDGKFNREQKTKDVSPPPAQSPVHNKGRDINWAPWRLRAKFTITEFAQILVKNDPAQTAQTTGVAAYIRLLIEAAKDHKISYLPAYGENYIGDRYVKEVDMYTEIPRAAALAWAKANQIDVAHIET